MPGVRGAGSLIRDVRHRCMVTREHNRQGFQRVCLGVAAALLLIAVMTTLQNRSRRNSAPPNRAVLERLRNAKHTQSSRPDSIYNWRVFKTASLRPASLRNAAMKFIGMDPREVSAMATGEPDFVFGLLAHYKGYEIIWVDNWTNFPIKLPTTPSGGFYVPRRRVVQAALRAIHASDGCLVKAGPNRYLVAKVSEKEDYRAAIRALGWLDGTPPPWAARSGSRRLDAQPGAAVKGTQPIPSETDQRPPLAGARR